MNRTIDIEFNEFPESPQTNLLDAITKKYVKSLDIDLLKLTALYKKRNLATVKEPYATKSIQHYVIFLQTQTYLNFNLDSLGKAKIQEKKIQEFWGNPFVDISTLNI